MLRGMRQGAWRDVRRSTHHALVTITTRLPQPAALHPVVAPVQHVSSGANHTSSTQQQQRRQVQCSASTSSGGTSSSTQRVFTYNRGKENSYQQSASSSTSSSTVSPEEAQRRRLAELGELLGESARIAASTGPRGFFRALQAAQAVGDITREYLTSASPQLDPPQVILRKLFERLGSTYIKLGQFIASSPSLFPDEYVLEFQKCLDKTQPVPFNDIKAIIEKELNGPYTQVFSQIDPVPIASASVAQVHSAVLKGSNKEVVLKVLKPGVEDVLEVDMSFVYLASRYLEFLQPELSRLSLTAIVSDIRASMLDEVDFTKEATHIQQFARFLDARGMRGLATCPEVYKQYSSRRLLVMDRLSGVPLTDYDAIRSITTKDPEAVLVSALNTWFASVMGAETFHADVHAGNLLVMRDGRVAFLDFGIVGRISPVTWRAVEALIASLSTGDYETMARALATIGACDTDVDYKKFGRDLEAFFTELEQVNTNVTIQGGAGGMAAAVEVDQTQLNRLFLNLVRIGETHGVRFPREFGLFLKQLLYFDRYTRILAPSLQVFNDDRIVVRDLSRRMR